ncbi:MAG: hypothetical protein PHX80_04465 [Candidatus Nanoarchaeia archaeon]|nr:hypothetical protein [Candidatus Nanoarchaeia archaeon]
MKNTNKSSDDLALGTKIIGDASGVQDKPEPSIKERLQKDLDDLRNQSEEHTKIVIDGINNQTSFP